MLDWLCPPEINAASDQQLNRDVVTAGTGEWLFKTDSYKEWQCSPGAFLWLSGQSNAIIPSHTETLQWGPENRSLRLAL